MSHNTIFSKSRYNREWQTRHHHTQVFSVYVKNISDQSIYSRVSKIEKTLTVRKGTTNERFTFAQTWFFGEESRTPQTSKKKSFTTIINSRWIKKWLLIKSRLQLLQNSPSQMFARVLALSLLLQIDDQLPRCCHLFKMTYDSAVL